MSKKQKEKLKETNVVEINKLQSIIDNGIQQIEKFRQQGINEKELKESIGGLYASVYSTIINALVITSETNFQLRKVSKNDYKLILPLLDKWKAKIKNEVLIKDDYAKFIEDIKEFDKTNPKYFSDRSKLIDLVKNKIEVPINASKLIQKIDTLREKTKIQHNEKIFKMDKPLTKHDEEIIQKIIKIIDGFTDKVQRSSEKMNTFAELRTKRGLTRKELKTILNHANGEEINAKKTFKLELELAEKIKEDEVREMVLSQINDQQIKHTENIQKLKEPITNELEEMTKGGQKISQGMIKFHCPYCEYQFSGNFDFSGEGIINCDKCNKEFRYIIGIARGMKGSTTRIVTFGPPPFSLRLKVGNGEKEIRFQSYNMIDVRSGDAILLTYKKVGFLNKNWSGEPTLIANFTTRLYTKL